MALNGRLGLECALAAHYDLVLSDMRMPELDGPGFYEAILRSRPAMANRFAFITGDTLSGEVQSFLNHTGAPHLEKPFLPQDVFDLLSRVIRGPEMWIDTSVARSKD